MRGETTLPQVCSPSVFAVKALRPVIEVKNGSEERCTSHEHRHGSYI